MQNRIEGGCTMWARQTIDSSIFFYKPDKWFKIWFYIVNRVNYKDTKLFKRGEALITYDEIMLKTRASKTQVHKCLVFLKKEGMVDNKRTTRGMIRIVLNYGVFQDMENYKETRETTSETMDRQLGDNSETVPIVEEGKEGNKEKKIYGEFKNVFLSDEEYKKITEYTGGNQDDYIEALDIYMKSTGKKYKDHYATLQGFWRRANPTVKKLNLKKATDEQAKEILSGKDAQLKEDLMFANPQLWKKCQQ